MKLLQWGFIGCGDVTERKSGPAFSEVEGSSVVAVMSRTEKHKANMMKTFLENVSQEKIDVNAVENNNNGDRDNNVNMEEVNRLREENEAQYFLYFSNK